MSSEKRKIGVLTFFQSNYGAVLQAFALQHYLKGISDCDVELIDFTTSQHRKASRIFQKSGSNNPLFRAADFLLTCLRYVPLKIRQVRTRRFKRAWITMSPRYSTIEELAINPTRADIYITGSDQVFNPSSPFSRVYYLDFLKDAPMKVAYAASFGISEFSDSLTEVIRPMINDFDYISCRERSGTAYINSFSSVSAETTVDPVFLLDEPFWSRLSVSSWHGRPYIFVYDLNGGEKLVALAKSVQAYIRAPIVCLTGNKRAFYKVDKLTFSAGPREFLGWIRDAAFVVTDSFHGSSFSMIFNKPFLSYVASERVSSRLINILSEVGEINRLVREDDINFLDVESYILPPGVDIASITLSSKAFIQHFLHCE